MGTDDHAPPVAPGTASVAEPIMALIEKSEMLRTIAAAQRELAFQAMEAGDPAGADHCALQGSMIDDRADELLSVATYLKAVAEGGTRVPVRRS